MAISISESDDSLMSITKSIGHRSSVGAFAESSLANFFVAILAVVSSSLAARILGPEGRGELAVIQLWPSYLITFGSLGLMAATSYYCSKYPERAAQTFMTAWIALVALAFPLMGLGYWLIPKVLANQNSRIIDSARVFLLLILIQCVGNLPYQALQGLGQFRVWNIIRVQFIILWIGVLIMAAWTGSTNSSFVAYGYLVAMTIHCATWMTGMLYFVPGPYRPDLRRLPDMLRYGVPSVAANLPQQLNLRLDQLLMAAFLPARTLGLYAVAVAWSGALSPLLGAVSQVIFPHLAGLHDHSAQAETATRVLRLSVLAAAILVLALLVTTPIFLPLLFGGDFRPAIPAALLLVVAGGVFNLNMIAGETLRGMGLPRLPLLAESVGLACTAGLLMLLLQRYQLMGAAIASLASYLVTFVTYVVLLAGKVNARPDKLLLPSARDVRFVLFRLGLARAVE